jgi:hypothetical protein
VKVWIIESPNSLGDYQYVGTAATLEGVRRIVRDAAEKYHDLLADEGELLSIDETAKGIERVTFRTEYDHWQATRVEVTA